MKLLPLAILIIIPIITWGVVVMRRVSQPPAPIDRRTQRFLYRLEAGVEAGYVLLGEELETELEQLTKQIQRGT